jgi:hypothetical protein
LESGNGREENLPFILDYLPIKRNIIIFNAGFSHKTVTPPSCRRFNFRLIQYWAYLKVESVSGRLALHSLNRLFSVIKFFMRKP